jgi:hypothetical protein
MTKSPFLVETKYTTFCDYYKELSKKSKYNFKCVMKKYQKFTFKKLDINDGLKLKTSFENIWSEQLVRKNHISKPNIPIYNNSIFFGCYDENGFIVCLHITEEYTNYCYSHMPMYDKRKYDELSKYSWFSLIKYIIENMNKVGLDMGGPCGRTKPHNCCGNCNPHFKFIVENRTLCDKYEYKFLYLTKKEKESAKKYIVYNNNIIILS